MAIQIALSWNDECEKELLEKGFEKTVVYTKMVGVGINTDEQVKAGTNQFFSMTHKPYQFLTASWWGIQAD